ncbi:MAG: hypothetical protein ABI680_10520 [Chthoniobacteraceae bacterium]
MPLLRLASSVGCLVLTAFNGYAAISITGVADKTKVSSAVTFTVQADPSAATTVATIDGQPVVVGASATVSDFGFHELQAESRNGSGVLVDSEIVRFIVRDPSRGNTEDGLPPFTPYRVVNDAPSAFAAGELHVIAPASWPVGLPIPIAARIVDDAGNGLRLNGLVRFAGLPAVRLQLRRGWGSAVAPAAVTEGVVTLDALLNGLNDDRPITFDTASFSNVSGTISSDTTWAANSRHHIEDTLTISAGATLTIQPGCLVTLASSVEVIVNGTLNVVGSEAAPVVFAPSAAGEFWGGIELPAATSRMDAANAIFTGAGEDQTWFDTHSGYSSHRPEQALFLVAGSGAGINVGAQLHLTDCYCFDVRGQMMNSKSKVWIDLNRTLMQKAVTCGELNGTKVTIASSALIEFPGESSEFTDADNDAIYFTSGDLSVRDSVIGFTKDDGIDSGGNGGDNPFTAAVDVTQFVQENNWFEGIFHEGNSLSGTRNVSYSGCVFFNCGQGVEAGYSAGGSGDGPNAVVDSCLFVGNMVAARWGDNYGSGYQYNASMEVKNSLLLASEFHDVWSYDWNDWTYYDTSALNTFGRPKLNVHDSYLSLPDPVHHPANVPWNPATSGALLNNFMPVPGSNVGVAISSYAPAQGDPATYPGEFTVRLSTFSSQEVSVDWTVEGKVESFAGNTAVLASGSLVFQPGETVRTITAPVASPGNYEILHVNLENPTHAEVTGEAWYFVAPVTSDPSLIGAGGWRFRETRSEPPANWRTLSFDDESPAATEWLPCTLPAGFGVGGVSFGTPVTPGPSDDRTKAFYFRNKFTVADTAGITGLTLRLRRDDAAVVWVNNESEPSVVSADGTFDPPYSYDATTLSTGRVPNSSNTGTYLTYQIPISKLVPGQNIVAIQVHQSSVTSSDLILDCELTANFQPPFKLHLTRSANQPVLWWFDDTALLEQSPDLEHWSVIPGAASPLPFLPQGEKGFFRLRRP